MSDDITLGAISDLGLESRIKSFEFRRIQNKIYDEVNILTIKSLKFKLNGNQEKSEELRQQSIKKKEEAHAIGYESIKFQEKASQLDRAYHKIFDMLGEDWEQYLNLDEAKFKKETV